MPRETLAPPRETLVAMYDSGMSYYAMAKKYSVSKTTPKKWLKRHGIIDDNGNRLQDPEPLPDPSKASVSKMEYLEPQKDEDSPQTQAPAQYNEALEHDPSGWHTLAYSQQRLILWLGDNNSTATVKEQAEYAGCDTKTISRWNNDPVYKQCLSEYVLVQAKHNWSLAFPKRMSDLMARGQERPEDRQLFARMLGLVSDGAITINTGASYQFNGAPRR